MKNIKSCAWLKGKSRTINTDDCKKCLQIPCVGRGLMKKVNEQLKELFDKGSVPPQSIIVERKEAIYLCSADEKMRNLMCSHSCNKNIQNLIICIGNECGYRVKYELKKVKQ
jgi:hypothetical protein